MISRLFQRPIPGALLFTSLMFITLLCGCPTAQQPQTPSTTDNSDQSGQTTTGTTTPSGSDRPIPPPVIDTSGDQGGSGSGGSGGGGGSGGSSQPGRAYLGFTQPFHPMTVNPPAIVNVVFNLALDARTSISTAQLVLARDDNGDRIPDVLDPATGNTVLQAWSATVQVGVNTLPFQTQLAVDAGCLTNGFGRFLLGARIFTTTGTSTVGYAPATVSIDVEPPAATWVNPQTDDLVSKAGGAMWTVQVSTEDNSPHTLLVELEDVDTGDRVEFGRGTYPAGQGTRTLETALAVLPTGTFYYFYSVFPEGSTPQGGTYAPNPSTGGRARLALTNRLVGQVAVESLGTGNQGAVLQGFNFNDLAGSAMTYAPDVDGDGDDEALIAARFGKPFIINDQGVGFGEAYMLYGGGGNNGPGHPATRLTGVHSFNAVAGGNIPGVAFPGIRMPMNTTYTRGISDVTFIPDMDGDGLPELVFSFPRVESLSLEAPAAVNGTPFQHPELVPDLQGMGNMEYDAIDYASGAWVPNVAQFARGGIVIVSSQNSLLKNAQEYNRKSDRLLDLHEVGQLFSGMYRPSLQMYARKVYQDQLTPTGCENCVTDVFDDQGVCTAGCGPCGEIDLNPAETEYQNWWVEWDTALSGQGPGGFEMPWTNVPADPPLANPSTFPFADPSWMDVDDKCVSHCVVQNVWYAWYEEYLCMLPLPGTGLACYGAWKADGDPAAVAWTGFPGPQVTPTVFTLIGDAYPAPVGARILGESIEDQFGTAVSADNTWLYISAPNRTALSADVPALEGTDRPAAGVVYQYRVNSPTAPNQPTRSQLWIEPGQVWPNPDRELPSRLDYTMPVPHQYIIETVGSIRGNGGNQSFDFSGAACAPHSASEISPADQLYGYEPYPVGTCGYYMDRTPQIVGPHDGAQIGSVRVLGDVNGDGNADFAVGSPDVKKTVVSGGNVTFTGPVVGSIFIVFGRSSGLEGDYLLDMLALDPGAAGRLHGVLLQGTSGTDKLTRAFDGVGDFNGDGIDDVVVGSEGNSGNRGAALVIFGSTTLESPVGGWTVPGIVGDGRAVRFIGQAVGDLAGANVAGVGDVDGDGYADILIAAPGAAGGKGRVYLIYGSPNFTDAGDVQLSQVGTVDAPGAVFTGHLASDHLGGGEKTVNNTDPNAGSTTATSRGVARMGDIDGDGLPDFAISAMLASPDGKTNAGEVYIIYGQRGP